MIIYTVWRVTNYDLKSFFSVVFGCKFFLELYSVLSRSFALKYAKHAVILKPILVLKSEPLVSLCQVLKREVFLTRRGRQFVRCCFTAILDFFIRCVSAARTDPVDRYKLIEYFQVQGSRRRQNVSCTGRTASVTTNGASTSRRLQTHDAFANAAWLVLLCKPYK